MKQGKLCEKLLPYSGALLFLLFVILLSYSMEEQVKEQATLHVNCPETLEVRLEIANTQSSIQKGLSGRTEICDALPCGMLFVLPSDGYSFWMKDMHFPLDLVFLSDENRILSITSLKPCKNEETCPLHALPKGTRYVLELPEGFAASCALHEGGDAVITRPPER